MCAMSEESLPPFAAVALRSFPGSVRRALGRFFGRRLLLLVLVAAVSFLFLNPRTGPQARKFARDAYGSVTSGE